MEAQQPSHSLQADSGLRLTSPPALADWFAADYIHGDRFAELADLRITSGSGKIPPQVSTEGRLLYCMTDRAGELFSAIRDRKHPCVLITHNADRNVTPSLFASKPACVRHWFAQNVTVDHPDLTPIPIGLERPGVSGGRTSPAPFQTAARQVTDTRNLTYLSYSDRTNRFERAAIRCSLGWRNWVTARYRPAPFEEYLREMIHHRSVLSPPGNGLDCHRTWESLYLGVIPLVRTSSAMRSFAKLFPMALFDGLALVTRRAVEQRITTARQEAGPDWQARLRFSWWAERITRASNEYTLN